MKNSFIETLENEICRIETVAEDMEKSGSSYILPQLQPSGIIQSIKLVVKLMGSLETQEITDSINSLKELCNAFHPSSNEVS